MAIKTNIKIQTDSGEILDYTTPEDLDISFNRIIDEYTEPDTRFGEFSYSFSLPKTKRNARILGFSNTYNVQRKFSVNPQGISVFNNDALVLSGILELESIERNSYECRFYSKLTQLTDVLEDVDLIDIDTMPIISDWNYETTIRNHINSNYKSSDETSYQFPMIFYNTFFTPYNVYNNLTDFEGYQFRDDGDRPQQNFYYILNRTQTGSDNEFYFHQFPLCFYVKSVLEGLLEYVGWSLSGSFWDTPEAKKIIMLYTGENDIYDSATYTSGGTTYLNTNKFLPEMGALNFIKSIINMFNLYILIDVNNKILLMDTYDTLFTSKVAPYRIDNLIDENSIVITKVDEYNFSIKFEQPENTNHLGDNYFFGKNSTNALTLSNYIKTSNEFHNTVYNHVGTTEGEIDIEFAAPKVKRMFIRNTDSYDGSVIDAEDHVIFLPDMSEQTRYDNDNNPFNKDQTDTTANNEESTIKFKGKPTLMYYYGISSSEFIQDSGKGACSEYFYIDMDNVKQRIGIASPFAYKTYRGTINDQLASGDSGSTASMYASYLQTIYLNMGTGYTGQTKYSLTFGDSFNLADTLYTKFYRNRIDRYTNSEVLEADIRISNVDWNSMQLNQPLIYRGEIYSLMELSDYNIVTGEAKIKMIKHL